MANFESGVKGYVKGVTTLVVPFPIDWNGHADISCKQCGYYQPTARKCGLTHNVVAFPEKFVGDFCPLEIMEDDKP